MCQLVGVWAMLETRVLLAAAIAAALVVGIGAQESTSCPDGPMSDGCRTCRDETNQANVLHSLPRMGGGGSLVSSQIADYNLLTCGGGTCAVTAVDVNDPASLATGPSDAAGTYAVGVLSLMAVLILLMLLSVIYGLLMCVVRYCCCCCRPLCKRTCPACLCGDSIPTQQRRCICGGFRKSNRTGKFQYPATERLLAIVGVGLVVAALGALIGVSWVLGNQGLTTASRDALDAPVPLLNVFRGLLTPLGNIIERTSGEVLPAFLSEFRDVWNTAVNVTELESALDCMNATIAAATPDASIINASVVTEVTAFVDAIEAGLDDIASDIDGISAGIAAVQTPLASLDGALASVSTGLLAVAAGVGNMSAALDEVVAVQDTITSPTSVVAQLDDDLAQLQANYPASSDLSDATDSATYFATMIATEADNAATRGAYVTPMETVLANLEALPDLDVTADRMQAFNYISRNATAEGGPIESLGLAVNQTEDAVALIPSAQSIIDKVNAISYAVGNVTLTPLNRTIDGLADTIAGGIDLSAVLDELDKLTHLTDVLGCIADLEEGLSGIRENLFLVSLDIDEDQLNSTLSDLVNVTKISDEIESQADFSGVFDFSGLLGDLADAQSDLEAGASFNTSSIESELGSLSTAASFDSSIHNQLADLNATLAEAVIPDSTISDFRTLASNIATMVAAMRRDIQLLQWYLDFADLRCSHDNTTDCSASGDSTCDAASTGSLCFSDSTRMGTLGGYYTLLGSAEPDVTSVRANLAAANSSAQSVDLSQTQADLSATQTSLADVDVDSFRTQLSDANSSLAAVDLNATVSATLVPLRDDLAALDIADMANVTIDTDEFSALTDNLDPILDLFREIDDVVQDNFPSYLVQLDPVRLAGIRRAGRVGDPDAPGDILTIVYETIDVVDNMTASLGNLTFPSLGGDDGNSSEADGGEDSESSNSTSTLLAPLEPTVRDLGLDELVRVITEGDHWPSGAIYATVYALTKYNGTKDSVFAVRNARLAADGDGIFLDAAGEPYPRSEYPDAGTLCLTADCITEENRKLHTVQLPAYLEATLPATSNLMPALGPNGSAYGTEAERKAAGEWQEEASLGLPAGVTDVPLSREHVTAVILYLGMALICIVGLCAMTVPLCCCRGETAGASAAFCPNLFAVAVWMAIPVFFFVAAFFMPPLVLMADVCAAQEPLLTRVANTIGTDDLCRGRGGVPTASGCLLSSVFESEFDCVANATEGLESLSAKCFEEDEFNATLSNEYTLGGTLDLGETVLIFARGCGETDALEDFYVSAAESLRENGTAFAYDFLVPFKANPLEMNGTASGNSSGNSSDSLITFEFKLKIAPPLFEVAVNLTNRLVHVLADELPGFADAAGCAGLTEIVGGLRDPMCCSTLGAMYWLAAPIPLTAFILCLCGSWISLFARKRIGKWPWGSDWEKVQAQPGAESGNDHISGVEYARARRGRGVPGKRF